MRIDRADKALLAELAIGQAQFRSSLLPFHVNMEPSFITSRKTLLDPPSASFIVHTQVDLCSFMIIT